MIGELNCSSCYVPRAAKKFNYNQRISWKLQSYFTCSFNGRNIQRNGSASAFTHESVYGDRAMIEIEAADK